MGLKYQQKYKIRCVLYLSYISVALRKFDRTELVEYFNFSVISIRVSFEGISPKGRIPLDEMVLLHTESNSIHQLCSNAMRKVQDFFNGA